MKRTTRARLAAAVLGTAVVLVPSTASAHVTVSSPDAAQGGYGKLVLRVPNESDTAATTRLTVTFPTDTPVTSIRTQPKPGWTAKVVMTKLDEPVEVGDLTVTEVVGSVVYTATAGGIGVGQFDEFQLSGGPLPETDTLVLPTKQEYADGEVADWSQVATGDEEPEKPAPTLALAAASDDGHGGHGAPADTEGDEAAGSSDDGTDTLARVLGGLGLVVGVGGVALALRENRRRARTDS
ncbi:YcnI family protein [Aeromicrobium sp. IC_218]|uniref:YcnI family copper-binding membrane protein n=1 Tax=Aeromicrobium sp. IC_218 TaxID=2545468 RepID=UPI00103EED26|nr:YcnI family protein [Aeromicrobium sp. IC_218]TCI95952.1 DUF1775 domain-containing protein [Aeromicrobium sp. IC_218]